MGMLFHEDMMTREELQNCTLLNRFTVYGDAGTAGDGVRKVTAAIDELALTCELQKEGGEWMGILFHEDMMTREDLQTCTLLIRFTVYGDAGTAEDRVPVHMDGRDPYYRMHRKE